MAAPITVVIFGASGDLTSRKLVPALFNLAQKGRLPAGLKVLGVSRTSYTDEAFREHLTGKAKEALTGAGDPFDASKWAEFAANVHYLAADVTQSAGTAQLSDWLKKREGSDPGRRLYYLSVSPELYPQLSGHLGEAGLNKEDGGFRRLIIEKPFGHDKATAVALNEALHRHWREDQLYRIDHYLGKDTVQNILIFRFANTLFEPLWNYQYIDHVQITVALPLKISAMKR
jgi:glucose-6-phosphate 1-dehydrogenase